MSQYEKIMLLGAAAVSAAYLGFASLMTDGIILGERSALFMGLCLLSFMGVVAAVMFLTSFFTKPAPGPPPDEREEVLDSAAGELGYYALDIGVFIVLLLALLESYAGQDVLGSFGLGRPEGIVFWLVSANAIAGVTRLLGAFILALRA